jgi:phospholipase/carboxylesterase
VTAFSELTTYGTSLEKATKAMILLHGRGASSEDILSLAPHLCDDNFYVAAPQAMGNIWYPNSFMDEESANEPYLSRAIQSIANLIDEITKQIPTKDIYLAGFSQGACLSLEVSSRHAKQYGGIIAFTGGLIGKNIDAKKYQGNFHGTKVFISNGDKDPYIPLERSLASKELLEKMGANVSLKIYPGRPHTVSNDEIDFVKKNIITQ